jgi:hypothetical protein
MALLYRQDINLKNDRQALDDILHKSDLTDTELQSDGRSGKLYRVDLGVSIDISRHDMWASWVEIDIDVAAESWLVDLWIDDIWSW